MNADEKIEKTAREAAEEIRQGFVTFQDRFTEITRRARQRFEDRDWTGHQNDARARLVVYSSTVDSVVRSIRERLGERSADEAVWSRMKATYAARMADDRNFELAETFFNSITRRIFSTVGINPEIEFVLEASAVQRREPDPSIYVRYECRGDTAGAVRRILERYQFDAGYRDADGDARRVAEAVEAYAAELPGSGRLDAIETLGSTFYRNKGAYVVGRLRIGPRVLPFVLPLLHERDGVIVDAVLLNENDVSILFSFTRSYFQVEATCPREVIIFLKTIMPIKPIAELYNALGFNRHGKTELYRSLRRYLRDTPDRFQIAEGDRGMVMIVFTLPYYDVVFKVIRDEFDYPKTTTRRDVLERYRLVFGRDRVGRLVDAQEFEHLKFGRERFSDELLHELTEHAAETVTVDGDDVVIRHLYTERKLTPLNLYIRRAGKRDAARVVLDYGDANKELAAANIFPGDFLLKNFGVTRHGRVVFYDYDELCLVTDCNFRDLPSPRRPEEELAPEPWFAVAENDIFPEEFERFLELDGPLRELFCRHHSDLFTTRFWRALQQRHRSGEVLDFFPYPDTVRLHPS